MNANELALGGQSKTAEFIEVSINPMVDLNYKTKKEILTLRRDSVNLHKELLNRKYKPSKIIFGQIISGKPWWGIIGCTVFGSGKKSIIGASEESRFLLNPFLLVAASSWSNEIWDQEKIKESDYKADDFPLCWQPSFLRIHPNKKTVQIAYEVSAYNDGLKSYDRLISDREPIDNFALVAYNARDFGYNFIYVPVEECKNIVNTESVKTATQIVQYIHCGGSSGYPGGCNNMSPGQKEFAHFKFTELPATVKVKLWKRNPGSINKKADITVFLELR